MSLSTILFTEYRSKVLGLILLHPGQQFFLREIARLTHTNPGTLKRELDKLVEAGIINFEKSGNQNYYSANQSSPIFEDLVNILRKTSGLVDVIQSALLPLVEQIDSAFIFGSMASGAVNEGSDIDLMLVGNVNFGDVVSLIYPLQASLAREINPKVFMSSEWLQLSKDKNSFLRDVMSKPRLFVIGTQLDLDQLTKE
jgi:predicted nucleotidyltransferase